MCKERPRTHRHNVSAHIHTVHIQTFCKRSCWFVPSHLCLFWPVPVSCVETLPALACVVSTTLRSPVSTKISSLHSFPPTTCWPLAGSGSSLNRSHGDKLIWTEFLCVFGSFLVLIQNLCVIYVTKYLNSFKQTIYFVLRHISVLKNELYILALRQQKKGL